MLSESKLQFEVCMRIITGVAKGIKLKVPKGLDVRPTADRVKESIFNILANLEVQVGRNAIIGANVLDLFAGTGNLGLEALSRGAAHALFVDHSMVSLATTKENINHADLSKVSEVHRGDSLKTLDKLAQSRRSFTLIFVDPPYNQGLVNVVLQKLDNIDVVENGGLIVVEYSKHEQLNADWQHLKLVRNERYGETLVTFLSRWKG
ncbi:16S rRNA (guanine(966)-N(2))-methyltransferase RsmD [Sporomusa sp. KB1]|jgi:16S rRNA (guanine(966)-N(2))-methyltransferase RsmD|uniref:16S rRNA (guanine(966)-N(2))-methyltransferase RsmD n=1 Tax=Sporomusa sp. KB1 TaxID=943346 RepID=UPI002106289B|nr:16S rRNA (guanine(966)-N(2))-methyltransferase RsmD [Sporomusa sp. KB1]